MAEDHTYRVLVRGRFTDLTDEGRQTLRAAQEAHDTLAAAFTAEGTLAYDRSLDFFSFRIELAAPDDIPERTLTDMAKARAAAAVEALGVDFRDLKTTTTNMNEVKIPSRRR
jgi:hypothetical protein